MSATLLANELSNLSSEAKRKNTDLRNAAEKSLQELKSLPATSEQQLAADISRRPAFIEPFLIACNTRNARFAGSGIVSLQRLVISKGLPKSRLKDALEAFNACTDLGLDIQLKILQALPSLLQNYVADLEGDLLSGALQVCSSLQAAKASTVSGVAAATLQQLVTTIFEKVSTEDDNAGNIDTTAEVPGKDGPIQVRPAAFDAYRVLRDLALAADERKTKFVSFTSLSAESSLELIWSCIDSNSELLNAHDELMSIIGANILPLVIRALSERLSFSVTVRSLRLLDLVLDRYMTAFPGDCEVALNLLTQALEPDAAPGWKRALVMEVLRDFFSDSNHVIDAYAAYDGAETGKTIVQDLMSAFVRLSTEKPAAIGLGQQSTVPTGPPSQKDAIYDQAVLEAAGGMSGVIGSALVSESSVPGISSQWSLPKVACMEQLDKSDPPALPETYIYALVLECFNGLSDALARIVLPLTVQHERSKTKGSNSTDTNGSGRRKRSTSFRVRAVPLNPLEDTDSPFAARIKTVAGVVEKCWPAVLATSSTFLNAALDDQYFRNLIKAYQRFAQVAGLLRLTTPRDALMTTLAKAAVPPHVLNAASAEPLRSPTTESPRVFSNPKSLLSVESFVSQASSLSMDKDKRTSLDGVRPVLSVRNLLCLRALLNLAIALGPTLKQSFAVIVGALKHADVVLSTTTPQNLTRQSSFSASRDFDPPSVVQAFTTEVNAVEAAASRLLESTADYPNEAFITVLETFCQLLHTKNDEVTSPSSPNLDQRPPSSSSPLSQRRTFSGLPGISSIAEIRARDYKFVIPKLGHLAELNVSRFAGEEAKVSGFKLLTDELLAISTVNTAPREARRSATNVLAKLTEAIIAYVAKEDSNERGVVQRRVLAVLLRLVDDIYVEHGELTPTDLEIQTQVLDCLRAILERSGDSLVAGWNRVIAIIGAAFEREGTPIRGADGDEVNFDWTQVSADLVSPQIGRIAFAAVQLICSDFMESLPDSVLLSLVELLHRFMCQPEDLNAALTAVTMAWNLSDFLFNRCSESEMADFIDKAREVEDLDAALQSSLRHSKPAQWLLLLVRLRDVAAGHAQRVQNAAFQTVCNVFKNHGSHLPPDAWDLLLRNTLLRIAREDSMLYTQDRKSSANSSAVSTPETDMSKAIIMGSSDVVAQHLRVIEQVASLPALWEVFLNILEGYLQVGDHSLNAAAYTALSRILSGLNSSATWSDPVHKTLNLWLKRLPTSLNGNPSRTNQDAYIAYADAGHELYRLAHDISADQTRTLLGNLYLCIRESDGPLYGADITSLSSLQTKAMEVMRDMRIEQPEVLACLVATLSKVAVLHHELSTTETRNTKPTFVAIAAEAIACLQDIVTPHVAKPGLLEALKDAVQSLAKIVEAKYTFRTEYKGTPLWRKAASTAVALAQPILEQARQNESEQTSRDAILASYVNIACGIVKANNLHLVEDRYKAHEDMLFDVECFQKLEEILTPRLERESLPASIRTTYARALFEASIIHETERGEIPSEGQSPLEGIKRIRQGRVKKVPYSWREDMSYACWKELITLSSGNDDHSAEHGNLARATAPFLVLRLAIPLRAYIADQPLRGRRPQPRSELEELLFAFEAIKDLRLAPEALGGGPGEKAHLQYLLPLLIEAVSTAGDTWSGADEVLKPLQGVLAAVSSSIVVAR